MTGNKKGMSPVPDRTHATNFLDSDDAPVFFHFTLTAAPPSPSAFLQILCKHLQSAWLMSYRPLLFQHINRIIRASRFQEINVPFNGSFSFR